MTESNYFLPIILHIWHWKRRYEETDTSFQIIFDFYTFTTITDYWINLSSLSTDNYNLPNSSDTQDFYHVNNTTAKRATTKCKLRPM